jgi:hypothetical protein
MAPSLRPSQTAPANPMHLSAPTWTATPVSIARRAGLEARSFAVLVRAGLIAPDLPHRSAGAARAIARYGVFGGLLTAAAALVDDPVTPAVAR